MSILNDTQIIQLAREGMISPWFSACEQRVQNTRPNGGLSLSWGTEAASYTACLGQRVMLPVGSATPLVPNCWDEQGVDMVTLAQGVPFVLYPGKFVIATTYETFHLPADIVADIRIKSTYAACGVFLSGAWGDPGFNGVYRLALVNMGPRPVCLYAGEGIVSMAFHRLEREAENVYNGVYQGKVTVDLMGNGSIERGR